MSERASSSNAIDLTTPVQFLPGGGPQRAELLQKLGIANVRDLLFFFPRDYQDLTDIRPIEQLEEGQLVSVLATVDETDVRDRGGGRSILGVLLKQGEQYLRAIWFDQPFMRARFPIGQLVLLSGKPKRQRPALGDGASANSHRRERDHAGGRRVVAGLSADRRAQATASAATDAGGDRRGIGGAGRGLSRGISRAARTVAIAGGAA